MIGEVSKDNQTYHYSDPSMSLNAHSSTLGLRKTKNIFAKKFSIKEERSLSFCNCLSKVLKYIILHIMITP